MPTAEQDILADISKKRELGQFLLSEEEGKRFLRSIGIETPDGSIVNQIDEAMNAARRLGFPLAMKGLVENIAHKSDHGLVKIGISNEHELEAAFTQISAKCMTLSNQWQVLIEKQIDGKGAFRGSRP